MWTYRPITIIIPTSTAEGRTDNENERLPSDFALAGGVAPTEVDVLDHISAISSKGIEKNLPFRQTRQTRRLSRLHARTARVPRRSLKTRQVITRLALPARDRLLIPELPVRLARVDPTPAGP